MDQDRIDDSVREALKFIQLTERTHQFSVEKKPSIKVAQFSEANSIEHLEENQSLLELFHKDSFKTISTAKNQKSGISSPRHSKQLGRISPSLHSAERSKRQLQTRNSPQPQYPMF